METKELEKITESITEIWKTVLEIDEIDPNESIFDMGGDSIIIVKSLNEIQEQFGLEIDITDVFEHDTVNQLSELIMEKMDS